MRKKGLPAVAVIIVAAGLAIAGATARPAPSADLSLPAATVLTPAMKNLIATGVPPADVTAEPGVWNYAGPNCPGPGWHCEPLGILGVMQAGTVSVAECVDPNNCVNIDQDADVNVAKCDQRLKTTAASAPQLCEISQTGQDNQATVVQVIEQTGSAVQGALQEAIIDQTATASKNQLQVHQETSQTTTETAPLGTPAVPTQDQDAYQVVRGPEESLIEIDNDEVSAGFPATQEAALAGDNQSQIDQAQVQWASGGARQTQNDGEYAPGVTLDEPDDCDPLFSPDAPNACVNLEQESGTGDNQSQLSQKIHEEATTQAPIYQQQGAEPVEVEVDPGPPPEFVTLLPGGNDGRVHQETTAPGISQDQDNQSKTQKLFPVGPLPAGATQIQSDPNGCCGFGSQGGLAAREVNQKSHQAASPEAAQLILMFGTTNSPMGTCEFNHDAQNNADQTSESASPESCAFFTMETTCTSGPPGEDSEPVGNCFTVRSDVD